MKRIVLALGLALGMACSDSHAFVDSDAGDAAATLDVATQFVDAAHEAGPNVCSGDLHSILDAQGNVIQACPPDQGCVGGQCVTACTAAAARTGSLGCDYVVSTPSFDAKILPPCFAVFVTNSWGSDTTLTVERDGKSYDVASFGRVVVDGQPETSWPAIPSTGIPKGAVAVLFMSDDPKSNVAVSTKGIPLTCPITPAIEQPFGTALSGSGLGATVTGRGKAWHIITSLPVTAYDILPYAPMNTPSKAYFPSADLLFPTTSWGVDYLAIVPMRATAGPQWGQLVASSPGTQVTIYPNVALPSGTGVIAAPANVTTTFTLDAGDYIQWQESNDMSGTIVQSNFPVSFIGGQTDGCYASSTSAGGGCASMHQSTPAVAALGNKYAVAPYTTRRADLQDEAVLYRFVGAAAGTTLSYAPAVPTAPTTLTTGQVVDFEATGGFVVTSQDNQHPFYVGQAMTGFDVTSGSRPGCFPNSSCEFVNGKCCLANPQFVNVLPPAQFLSTYVFFADPAYATTNLVLVRGKSAQGGFADVTLDCAGALTGWKPMGSSGEFEMTNVDLVRATIPNGTCSAGARTATSAGPFSIAVWGLSEFSAYAYPAGGYVAPINPIVVSPPK